MKSWYKRNGKIQQEEYIFKINEFTTVSQMTGKKAIKEFKFNVKEEIQQIILVEPPNLV